MWVDGPSVNFRKEEFAPNCAELRRIAPNCAELRGVRDGSLLERPRAELAREEED